MIWLSWSSPASAYTWMIRHGYNGCTPCHADPAGGGLLTEYGRAQGDLLLRTQYSKAHADEEASSTAGFLFGLAPLPKELLLGGALRELYMINKLPGGQTEKEWIFMQSDLLGQLSVGRLRFNGSIGYQKESAREAAITHNTENNIVSRTHWVGYALGEDEAWLLRAGRMNLPFGLRLIEHTLWVRSQTRTDINSNQQHGVSLSYNTPSFRFEVMGIAGNFQINPDRYRERGYSGFAEWSVAERLSLGISSLLTYAKSDQSLRQETVRQVHGGFARYSPWSPLVLLFEGDAIIRMPSEGTNQVGYTGLLMADYEAIQGVHVIGTGELLNSGQHNTDTVYGEWASLAWFFLPHADIRFDFVNRSLSVMGQTQSYQTYLAQLHLYL